MILKCLNKIFLISYLILWIMPESIQIISASSSSAASSPFSFKCWHFPLLLASIFHFLAHTIWPQITQLDAIEILEEVAERHPELAVVIEVQANLFFGLFWDVAPLGGSERKYFRLEFFNLKFHFKEKNSLITPRSIPLGIISPWISQSQQGNLARSIWRDNVHHLCFSDWISVSSNQPLRSLSFRYTRIWLNTAAHHRVPLESFLQNVEQISWRFIQLVHLSHSSSEIFHGLARGASFKCLIRSVEFSVGFLQKGAPELILLGRVHVHQLTAISWQTIINHDINPLAVLPETAMTSIL